MTKPAEPIEPTRLFKNTCTCGGYAWSMNGRDRRHPHMDWCPQLEEYAEYIKQEDAKNARSSR